jgi:hypothetical protein
LYIHGDSLLLLLHLALGLREFLGNPDPVLLLFLCNALFLSLSFLPDLLL